MVLDEMEVLSKEEMKDNMFREMIKAEKKEGLVLKNRFAKMIPGH